MEMVCPPVDTNTVWSWQMLALGNAGHVAHETSLDKRWPMLCHNHSLMWEKSQETQTESSLILMSAF